MINFKSAITITAFLGLLSGCTSSRNQERSYAHSHSGKEHTHYPLQDSVLSHKLIFPSKVPDRIIANLTATPENSFAVNWRTSTEIDSGFVQVAKATDGPEFRLSGVKTIDARTQAVSNQNIKYGEPMVHAHYHSAVVTELEPDTRYAYRVGYGGKDDKLWSEWFHISTASAKEQNNFSFIYFGDAQNEVKSMWSMVIRGSFSLFPKVDFMLHAGDLVNDRDSNLEWGEWFYAGSFIHASVPSVMTPGNHEYRKEQLSVLWSPQFTLPANGPIEEIKETCYYVDYQDMRLISIDAVSLEDKKKSRKAQVEWLEKLLKNNPKKWTTIFMHYPILSVAEKRDDDNPITKQVLKPIIDKYKVDLVLQGHDHTYARGQVKNLPTGISGIDEVGTVYAVSVSGPKMYTSQAQQWMDTREEYTQLFQIISVKGDTLSYESYSPIGNLYDAFDLIKKDGKKELINRIPERPMRLKKNFLKDED